MHNTGLGWVVLFFGLMVALLVYIVHTTRDEMIHGKGYPVPYGDRIRSALASFSAGALSAGLLVAVILMATLW